MDDDDPENMLNLGPAARRYAELYPSVQPRLKAILASKDPKLSQSVASLARALRDQQARRLERLVAAYGLTRAESRLALHIIDGGSIAEYAQLAHVTPGTARVQLKAVFAKTGVSRQAQLIKLGQGGL
jgi:DNA-binding CsgD family transcriptional regulator